MAHVEILVRPIRFKGLNFWHMFMHPRLCIYYNYVIQKLLIAISNYIIYKEAFIREAPS